MIKVLGQFHHLLLVLRKSTLLDTLRVQCDTILLDLEVLINQSLIREGRTKRRHLVNLPIEDEESIQFRILEAILFLIQVDGLLTLLHDLEHVLCICICDYTTLA